MDSSSVKILKSSAMRDLRAVQQVLRLWDPIGAQPGRAGPSDEYDSYAGHIVTLARNGGSREDIARHLDQLCSDAMGLTNTAEGRQHNLRFADEVLKAVSLSNPSLERP